MDRGASNSQGPLDTGRDWELAIAKDKDLQPTSWTLMN
jgi:hypothetical protein